MKNSLLCNIFCLLILTISSCSKNSENPQLPSITQEGKNTFGCMVDGKIFINSSPFIGPPSLNAYYKKNNVSHDFIIGAISNREDKPIGGIKINIIENSIFEVNKLYFINTNHSYAVTDIKFDEYKSINQTGTLSFIKFDTINNIASGKFEFKAVNYIGNSMTITQGRI